MRKNSALKIAACVGLLILTGCQQNLVRSDFISPHAGDSIARNNSAQTIDPWPIHAYDTKIETSAKRQADARKRYRDKAPLATANVQGAGQASSNTTTGN